MRIYPRVLLRSGRRTRVTPSFLHRSFRNSASASEPPLIQIENATFYRRNPTPYLSQEESSNNRALFANLQFQLTAEASPEEHWAVVGPSNAGKTTLLEILRGRHLCFPPNGRRYPYLATEAVGKKDNRLRNPSLAIQYVGFSNEKGLSGMGTYMSARYESRREVTDFSLLDYLKGNVHLNALEDATDAEMDRLLGRVIDDLKLDQLLHMPVNNLSNGQSRRARIAKALLGRPELLLLDEPFMGLDPPTSLQISPLLHQLAQSQSPRLLLALRPQDPIPEWITHIAFLGENLQVTHSGAREDVAASLLAQTIHNNNTSADLAKGATFRFHVGLAKSLARSTSSTEEQPNTQPINFNRQSHYKSGKSLISADGIQVKYGDKTILGDWRERHPRSGRLKSPGLHWKVHEGDRWGLFGANGSGKTTLISMITSDHPQAYSNPLRVFGRHRLPTEGTLGISLFELQSRIGHSSPEVHAFFPRHLTVRQTLESAYADTPMTKPVLTARDDARIDACLRWFQAELNPAVGPNFFLSFGGDESPEISTAWSEIYRNTRNEQWFEHATARAASIEWADSLLFGELSVSAQKVALFLRAIVKAPEIVVLDEAFSGLDDLIRDKCLLFLEEGETARVADSNLPLTRQNTVKTGHAKTTTFGESIQQSGFGGGLSGSQALIVVSHVKEELPMSIKDFLFLPEPGKGKSSRIGNVGTKPLRDNAKKWNEIWGV